MHIIVVGAGHMGRGLARRLCRQGHDVTVLDRRREKLDELLNKSAIYDVSVVEMGKKLAPDINPGSRWSIMARCKQLGVKMMKETKVLEIRKDGVLVENAEGQKLLPADTVVMAAGAKPNNDLYEAVKDKIPNCALIGDAVKVARIPDAVESAYTLAASI